ncbi:MAG: cellulase family glycosylhydrolase [Anaerolinea sp.]|nr:cellulase family glycosylhydrolase [Anaerolinea sp.]
MLRPLSLIVGIVLILTVPVSAQDPFMGWAVTAPPFTSLTYGIQAFLWWDEYAAGLHIDWVRLMVFSHIKQTFAWEDLEPEPDVWDFSRADAIVQQVEEKGLRLIARLSDAPTWAHPAIDRDLRPEIVDAPPDDLADWAEYCGTIAARYAGRIAGYQIWNEPNLSREWGGREPDPAGYVALLAACSDAIRAADPDAVIISAGMAPTGTWDATAWPDDLFLQRLYDLHFQRHIDVLGVHAPGYAPPSVAPADAPGGHRFFSFRRVEDIRRLMIRNGDAARQIAILEVGWTTDPHDPAYSWFAVDEETQARYLVEAYSYAAEHWSPWVGLMSAIYIADTGWTDADEERWWAITTPDNYVRPAYIALANMAKYCGTDYRPARAPDSPEALGLVPVTPCR